jgi:hypothetical protein
MNIEELNVKIEKKKADIEKRKSITLKFEKKFEILTDEFERKWTPEDIRTSNNKLRDLEIQLENLYKQKEKVKTKNEIERIPVIEEFLEQWKIKAIEWYTQNYNSLLEYIKERSNKQKQFEQWKQEKGIFHYNSKEAKEKEVELGIDYKTHTMRMKMRFNVLTLKLYDNRNNWKQILEKEIELDKNNKRALFVNRVKEITGLINDAKGLSIGDNGEINGIVIGELGKAKVETISAGGYNIQCWHFRVLVHKFK